MKTDIDATTGLPTPPEGMWWRVRRDTCRHTYGTRWEYKPGVYAELVRNKTTRVKRFLLPDKVTTEVEVVVRERVGKVLTDAGWNDTIGRWYAATYDYEVTPENIQHTARRLLKELELKNQEAVERETRRRAKVAETARVNALLGDYPPKKLEVGK